MKKALLLLVSITTILHSYSQQKTERIFNPFKVDISAGIASPQKSNQLPSNGGFLLSLEPKYNITDRFAVGIRMEGAVTVRGKGFVFYFNRAQEKEYVHHFIGSFIATGDYYFTNKNFRPFISGGAGFAVCSISSYQFSDSSYISLPNEHKFEGLIRTGFEVSIFRLAVEYNFIPKSYYKNIRYKNSYYGIKLGFLIGGGRYKRSNHNSIITSPNTKPLW